MAADTETPSRVKKLLSSFLSTISQTTAENETVESSNPDDSSSGTTSVEESSVSDARNRRLFYKHVETFSPLTWFAKPLDLSPLVCARYGWENVEYDMLQCVNCKAFLCGQLPKAVDTQVYRESCNKLKKNLTESHQKLCKWSSSPCPESFLCVPFHNREEVLNNFWFRVTSLQCARIPVISYSSIEEKGVTKENICLYAEAVRRNDDGQRDCALDVILCALCGWLYSESQVNILQCNLCRRKIGLWNYNNENTEESEHLHVNPTNKKNSSTHSSENRKATEEKVTENKSAVKHNGIHCGDSENVGKSEDSVCMNGNSVTDNRETSDKGSKYSEKKDAHENKDEDDCEEPERKRPRLEKQSFDPIAEHRYWCPWLQTESLNLYLEHVQNQGPSPNVSPAKSPTSPIEQLQSSATDKPSEHREPAWLLVTKILSHSSEAEFYRQMKQSPQIEGLRHLRKVLRQCTSSTSPTK